MTPEQKAKAYDEALEKARKHYGETPNNVYRAMLESLFPELKESEDERIRKSLIDMLKNDEKHYLKEIAWLEKIGKNTTNKVESNLLTHERAMEISPFMRSGFENKDKVKPKFHEGEWVVYECGEETATLQITRIVGETYVFSDDSTLSVADENTLRLWDITKDAKDGDVLIFEGFYNSIVLFQGIGINGKGRINYHCKCDLGDYSFSVQGDAACLGTVERDAEHYHPATKEQRDTLMKAMANAGYTFDFDKKELKKIEKNSNWSEDDVKEIGVDLEKLGEIARHLIAVKEHIEDMRLDKKEWLMLEKIGYPERFKAQKGEKV